MCGLTTVDELEVVYIDFCCICNKKVFSLAIHGAMASVVVKHGNARDLFYIFFNYFFLIFTNKITHSLAFRSLIRYFTVEVSARKKAHLASLVRFFLP